MAMSGWSSRRGTSCRGGNGARLARADGRVGQERGRTPCGPRADLVAIEPADSAEASSLALRRDRHDGQGRPLGRSRRTAYLDHGPGRRSVEEVGIGPRDQDGAAGIPRPVASPSDLAEERSPALAWRRVQPASRGLPGGRPDQPLAPAARPVRAPERGVTGLPPRPHDRAVDREHPPAHCRRNAGRPSTHWRGWTSIAREKKAGNSSRPEAPPPRTSPSSRKDSARARGTGRRADRGTERPASPNRPRLETARGFPSITSPPTRPRVARGSPRRAGSRRAPKCSPIIAQRVVRVGIRAAAARAGRWKVVLVAQEEDPARTQQPVRLQEALEVTRARSRSWP